MNSTVLAAAIGVGGTVIVGTAGVWGTFKAASSALDAAREARLWDQRAGVYVEAIAAVTYRQTKRHVDTSHFADEHDSPQLANSRLRTYRQPEWFDVEARMRAFGSAQVSASFRACNEAHVKVMDAYEAYDQRRGVADAGAARDRFRGLFVAAENADDRLMDLISAELQAAKAPGRGRQWRGRSRPADLARSEGLEPPTS